MPWSFNVLTKKLGLKEGKKEKFYGTLNNGIPFHVRPFKIKENDDALKKYIQTYFHEYDNSVISKFCVYFITNTSKTKNIVDYLEMKNVCGGHF